MLCAGEVYPWPGLALTAIFNAAVFGLVVVLQAELKDKAPRVNEVGAAWWRCLAWEAYQGWVPPGGAAWHGKPTTGGCCPVVLLGMGSLPKVRRCCIWPQATYQGTGDALHMGQMLCTWDLPHQGPAGPPPSCSLLLSCALPHAPPPGLSTHCLPWARTPPSGALQPILPRTHCPPGPWMQLRIAALIRRDHEKDNPSWSGAPAFPSSKIGSIVVGIATGSEKDSVLRITPEQLEA